MTPAQERERFENRISDLLAYDPMTGVLTWKAKPNRNVPIGREVGRANQWGHMTFGMGGKTLMVHRVAWFLYYGRWPEHQIDHINGDKSDNRIVNLRDVPQEKNMQNQRQPHRGSKSGLLGVHVNPASSIKPWGASIKADGRRLYLGSFACKHEAHAAYLAAKAALHDTGATP